MTVFEVHQQLALRYKAMIDLAIENKKSGPNIFRMTFPNLLWMIDRICEEGALWPIDKVARWIGFIQCAVVQTGLTTVDDERNFSRPLFHEAYSEAGLEIPKTNQL